MAELTLDILITCDDENRRGGIKSLYVANRTTVTSFTPDVTDHEYTAVVMDASTDNWFEIQGDDEAISYNAEGSKENGSSMQESVIEAQIPKLEKTKAKAVNQLFQSCKVIAIIETYATDSAGVNIAFVIGFDEVLGLDAALEANVTSTVEAELQGLNAYILALNGKQAEVARQFTGSIDLNQGGTKTFS